MAINKVVYGADTLLDLTEDTVTEDKVLKGETFHDRSGVSRTGNVNVPVPEDITVVDEFISYNGGRVKSVQMELKPIQDLHGYPEPWVGGAGKNKVGLNHSPQHAEYVSPGLSISNRTDDSVTLEVTSAGTFKSVWLYYTLKAGTYTASVKTESSDSYSPTVSIYKDGDNTLLAVGITQGVSKTFTIASDMVVNIRFFATEADSTLRTVRFYEFQLEEGSTSTTYEPYENICPISGHTQAKLEQRGKNRLPNIIEQRSTHSFWVGQSSGSTYPFHFEKDKTYAISFDSNYSTSSMYYAESSGVDTEIGRSGSTFTPSKDMDVDLWIYGGGLSEVSNVQIELGSTATDYEPYQGKDYIINLGGTYYWLRGDVVSGKWYVVGKVVDLGTSAWTYRSDIGLFQAQNFGIDYSKDPTKENISSAYPFTWVYESGSAATASMPNFSFALYGGNSQILWVKDSRYTDPDLFKTAMTGQMACLYLATPIPLDLTPQQILAIIGENNFSAPLEQQEIIEIIARNIAEFNEVIDDENISDKFTYSSEKIEDRLEDFVDKDAVEEKSATTEFTTINGGLLSECKVTLVPVQSGSGDPSPDNVRPISGHTQVDVGDDGKNLWGGNVTINNVFSNAFPIDVGANSVTISLKNASGKQINCRGYDENGSVIIPTFKLLDATDTSGSYTLALTQKTYINIIISGGADADIPNVSDVQIELGSTATAYVPYNGYQITVNLGGTYYSGTLDVVSGKLMNDGKKVVCVLDGTEGFSKSSTYQGSFYRNWSYFNPAGKNAPFKCSHAKFVTFASGEYAYGKCSSDSSVNLWLGQPEWTVTDFHNYLATQYANGTPVTIEYEVNSPTETETQLSPTTVKALVGENHLSAPLDGQEITESKYRELFTWDEVEEIAQKIADSKIDNHNTSYDTTFSSAFTEARYVKKIYEAPALTALQIVLSGATSITFNHQLIFSDAQTCCELIQFGSGARIGITDVAISQGSVTFTFDSPLTKAIGFRCRITNDFVS